VYIAERKYGKGKKMEENKDGDSNELLISN